WAASRGAIAIDPGFWADGSSRVPPCATRGQRWRTRGTACRSIASAVSSARAGVSQPPWTGAGTDRFGGDGNDRGRSDGVSERIRPRLAPRKLDHVGDDRERGQHGHRADGSGLPGALDPRRSGEEAKEYLATRRWLFCGLRSGRGERGASGSLGLEPSGAALARRDSGRRGRHSDSGCTRRTVSLASNVRPSGVSGLSARSVARIGEEETVRSQGPIPSRLEVESAFTTRYRNC